MYDNRGYTLVEILVATVLMLTIVGGAIAAYRGYDERQKLVNAGRELANVLRDIQQKARIGDKPTQCPSNLESWLIEFTVDASNNYFYSIEASCGGEDIAKRNYQLSQAYGVMFDSMPGQISFEVLTGKPDNNYTLDLTKDARTYRIEVSSGGAIRDQGIIEED